MRFRTAGILSALLVTAMLALPRVAGHLARSYVEQGIKTIPSYQRPFFELAMFFGSWWWVMAPLTVSVLFIIAIITAATRSVRNKHN